MKHLVLAAALAAIVSAPAFAADGGLGRILSYSRSNIDGSEAETIHQYRPSADRVLVNKQMEPCTNAALVVGEIDVASGEVGRIVTGRLNRAGGQDAFGDIVLDRAARRIDLALKLPQGEIRLSTTVPDRPWMLYDFDLADLNSLLPRRADWRSDFSFGMALLWPEGDPSNALTYRGRLDARFVAEETWRGRPALRFEVGGPAFEGGEGGMLWIDSRGGYILEARWSRPNHPGYRDFRLTLDDDRLGGDDAWTALMLSHWQGCPTPG